MSNSDTRKYAMLGWFVWTLAKRRLRRSSRSEDAAPRRRRPLLRIVLAVAVLGALAAVWAKRSAGDGAEWDDTPA